MPLLPSQYAALKAFIAADPVLSQAAPNEDGDDFIALELNKIASPAFEGAITRQEVGAARAA